MGGISLSCSSLCWVRAFLTGLRDTRPIKTIAIAVPVPFSAQFWPSPFAFLASFNIMPKAVAYIVRILILMIRTIPSIVWALMWIRADRAWRRLRRYHAAGLLDRHDLQNVHHGYRRSGYAHSRKSGRHGLHAVPENPLRRSAAADGKLHLDYIYRFDINLKDATTPGIVGAGGIGASLVQCLKLRQVGVWSAVRLGPDGACSDHRTHLHAHPQKACARRIKNWGRSERPQRILKGHCYGKEIDNLLYQRYPRLLLAD